MSYQAINEYREICAKAGYTDEAGRLQDVAQRILADFNRHLVKGGVVAGYGLVGHDARVACDQTIA